jgi:hypothetical protein
MASWLQVAVWTSSMRVLTWQGQVNGGALPLASANFRQLSSAGVDALLMSAYEQDGGVVVEHIIRTIAMVHIKVKNEHLQQTCIWLNLLL